MSDENSRIIEKTSMKSLSLIFKLLHKGGMVDASCTNLGTHALFLSGDTPSIGEDLQRQIKQGENFPSEASCAPQQRG